MSKKLVIRINNLKDAEISDSYEVSEETFIRWDRVIGVLVLAALLLTVLIWSGWYFLQEGKPDNETLHATAVTENTVSSIDSHAAIRQESTANPVEPVANPLEPVVAEKLTHVENSIKIEEPVLEVEEPAAAREEPVVQAEEPVVQAEELVVEIDESVVEIEVPVVEVEESITESNRAPQPQVSQVFSDPVVIESKRIVKAQLTHRVNNNKPVDRLGNIISMNDDKLIRVYLFTGMEGLKGETLYHDWYLSGKKMARVKINVRSDKTSASSSKFIDQYMTGDWRVKVTTNRGDELVSAQFKVMP